MTTCERESQAGETRASYSDDEFGYRDQWVEGGGQPYTGKDYGGKATEILTTGLERLYSAPVGFAMHDPGHFELIVRILNKL